LNKLTVWLKEIPMRLLHVDSSILGGNSVSRTLTSEIVEAEKRRTPGLEVIYRDLAERPLQHISSSHLAAAQAEPVKLPAPLQQDLAQGQAALEEFLAADIVVVGSPMYNFSVPSQLKAWIDRLAVAGKTFRYGPNGPEGLAGRKKVIVASSRGGTYGEDSPAAGLDHQEKYLTSIFNFFGITDITFIRAEGLAVSDRRNSAIQSAREAIATLV
jgi:FMN-dependent NADH-azoreductase